MDSQLEPKNLEEKDNLLGKMDECGDRAQYHNLVDILFVLDATGSMSWCMDQMKKTVCKIMKKFSDQQYNIKFAIELYRDHPPMEYSYVEKHFDLRNIDAIIKIIDEECEVGGGGDFPEAVFDGLVNGLKKTTWRISTDKLTKSKRFLFHGCDAPPHGQQYGSTSSDNNWTKNGCPCGLNRHNVKQLLDEYNVNYSLIKCGDGVETMATLFKECFAQRFKRELQIKKSEIKKKKYKHLGRIERKRSVQYMEEIQREERGSIGSVASSSSSSFSSSSGRSRSRSLSPRSRSKSIKRRKREVSCQSKNSTPRSSKRRRSRSPTPSSRRKQKIRNASCQSLGSRASVEIKKPAESKKQKRERSPSLGSCQLKKSRKNQKKAQASPKQRVRKGSLKKMPMALRSRQDEKSVQKPKASKKSKKKKKNKKKHVSSSDSDDARSMASLVLSDIEDGIGDYEKSKK